MKKSTAMLYEEGRVLNLLSLLINAGIPLITGYRIAAETSPTFAAALVEASEDIESGGDMTKVFVKHAKEGLFSSFVPAFIKAGMIGGCLEKAFPNAAKMVAAIGRFQDSDVMLEKVRTIRFYQLLGTMIECGVPILEVLRHATSEYPPEVSASIINPVREGEMLTNGLKENPLYFTSLDCGFMAIGEMTGSLIFLCQESARIKEELLLAELKHPLDPTLAEEVLHYHYFWAMMEVEATTLESLKNLSKNSLTKRKRDAFAALVSKVEAGAPLGLAMESLPDQFPSYLSGILKSAASNEEVIRRYMKIIVSDLLWRLSHT